MVVPHGGEDAHPPNQNDQHKLEGCHLRTGPPVKRPTRTRRVSKTTKAETLAPDPASQDFVKVFYPTVFGEASLSEQNWI